MEAERSKSLIKGIATLTIGTVLGLVIMAFIRPSLPPDEIVVRGIDGTVNVAISWEDVPEFIQDNMSLLYELEQNISYLTTQLTLRNGQITNLQEENLRLLVAVDSLELRYQERVNDFVRRMDELYNQIGLLQFENEELRTRIPPPPEPPREAVPFYSIPQSSAFERTPRQTWGAVHWYNENTSFTSLGVEYLSAATFRSSNLENAFARYSFVNANFSTITAVLGHVDNGGGNRSQFQVWLDGTLTYTFDVYQNMMLKNISIDISNTNILEFRLHGNNIHIGLGNMMIS